jgi:predicted Zn-dependent peptidase
MKFQMKKIVLFAILLSFGLGLQAQIDRSKYPEPAPAREIKLGEASNFTLENGLQVFVVENHKLPRVAFSLVFDRDPLMEGEKAGFLSIVGDMLMGGTSTRNKEQLDEEIDFIGASLNVSSSSVYGAALKKHQQKVLDLMTDVLFNPVFPESELSKLKKQSFSTLAASKDEPSSISGRLVNRLNFGANHPYGEISTEATVEAITLDDIKSYYKTFFKPNIAYLAIVGDITAEEAKPLVEQYFSAWEAAEVPTFEYPQPATPSENTVALVDRSASVQSVINVTYPIDLTYNSPDYVASRVLNYILGGGSASRLFLKLREDKGYTYGAYSSLSADLLAGSFSAYANVQNAVTDSAVAEFINEIKKLRDEGITEEELINAKANISGAFGRSLENPSTIANFAINTKRYQLPDNFYATYLQQLDHLTVEDINTVAKKYLKPENMHLTVVGNASEIEAGLTSFGKVVKYNNMAEPAKEISMDESITPQQVINQYLDAIGGKDQAAAIQTMRMETQSDFQGMSLSMSYVHDLPNEQFANKTTVMGNVATSTIVKDGKAQITAMGQTQEVGENEMAALKIGMYIFPEIHLEEAGFELSLDGIKEVDGKQAYKLVISANNQALMSNYYEVDSGLKIKSENPEMGEVFYEDYSQNETILYPMKMVIKSPMMPMALEAKVSKLEFNAQVSADDFK